MYNPQTAIWRRGGFTLVELLVALALMLVLATIAVLFIPRVNEEQRATQGADAVSGWLLIAKQRALRDHVPTGIRFTPELVAGFQVARNLAYVQEPEPFISQGTTLTLIVPPSGTPPTSPYSMTATTASGAPFDFYTAFGPTNPEAWPVQPGDYLELGGGGPVYSIVAITNSNPATPSIGDLLTLASVPQPPGTPAPGTPIPYTQWRILRQPRFVAGEQPLQLPESVAIDLSGASVGVPQRPVPYGTGAVFEIMFGPSGQVIGKGSGSDKIILCVHDVTQDRAPATRPVMAKPVLVTIQIRTGQIGAHPIDPPPSTDYYSFARDGQSSGL